MQYPASSPLLPPIEVLRARLLDKQTTQLRLLHVKGYLRESQGAMEIRRYAETDPQCIAARRALEESFEFGGSFATAVTENIAKTLQSSSSARLSSRIFSNTRQTTCIICKEEGPCKRICPTCKAAVICEQCLDTSITQYGRDICVLCFRSMQIPISPSPPPLLDT
jgi:hypothetical protein